MEVPGIAVVADYCNIYLYHNVNSWRTTNVKVYNYDEAKYRECSGKTYALYKEEYDIGMVMEKILNLKTKRKRPGLYEIELYKFIVDMSEIMHI